MKTSKPLSLFPRDACFLLSAGAALVFQVVFAVWAGCYRDVLLLDPGYKPVTKEYLLWYVEHDTTRPNEVELVKLTGVLALAFGLLAVLGVLYLLIRKEYRASLGPRRAVPVLAVYALANAAISYYIRYMAPHYRLYMRLAFTELACLLLLCLLGLVLRSRARQAGEDRGGDNSPELP